MTNSSVAIVIGVNLAMVAVGLWLLPSLAKLSGLFRTTARSFTHWRQGAEAAFHPLPTLLQRTAKTLKHSRQTWTTNRKRLALLQTLLRCWPR
ncbi:MAG: hypothetical protein Q6J68_01550 [Thermostichales cyanobacterium SZTDM-1c_bins_54]